MNPRFQCVRCKREFPSVAKLEEHPCGKGAGGILATLLGTVGRGENPPTEKSQKVATKIEQG
jgi:hypothetical protein